MTTTVLETSTQREAPVREPEARFRDLIAAEWIKLWSLRSTSWAFLATAFIVIGLNLNGTYGDYSNYPHYGAGIKEEFVPYWAISDAFNNGAAYLLVIAAGAMGANMIVSEYGTRLIRTTFAAVPSRRSVMAAKATVASATFAVFGAVVASVSFWLSQAVLSGRHAGVSIAYPGALRVVIASALLAPMAALIGMGVGTVVRHTATTMVGLIVLNVVMPALLLDERRVSAAIDEALPYTAWERLSAVGDDTGPGPISTTIAHSWVVYAVWCVAAVIVAVVVADRRDV
jgi:ABC-type transport system involved in multi-copper enzyme maturation permease subunit